MMIRPSRIICGLTSEFDRNVTCSGVPLGICMRHKSDCGRAATRVSTMPFLPRVDANTRYAPSGDHVGSKSETAPVAPLATAVQVFVAMLTVKIRQPVAADARPA